MGTLISMDDIGRYELNNEILLTGAGFTYDFGGFLAKQMWALIFNSPKIQKYPGIKKLMRDEFSYETVYHEVINGNFGEDEKNNLTDAIMSAYEKLDENILNYKNRPLPPVDISKVNHFIDKFAGHHKKKGFFFTLNQDLFVERYCRDLNYSIATLGVSMKPNNSERKLGRDDYIQLPANKDAIKENLISQCDFFYVKLHGSQNWKSFDGSDQMVIGKDKKGLIEKEPLLKYYSECFKKVLSRSDIRLFVIGYGFGDEHINEIISDSIKKHNLRLYVMSPDNPENFKNNLYNHLPCGKTIWNGLTGYYPYSLSTVFPHNGGDTVGHKLIKNSYFDV